MRTWMRFCLVPMLSVLFCTMLQAAEPNVRGVDGLREQVRLPILINDLPSDGAATLSWRFFSEDGKGTPERVWQEKDGFIVCKGLPRGYIRTDQEFTDFTFRMEWRWPKAKKPGCGGILVRMTGKDTIWPKSLEAQINSPDAGDFWGLVGYNLNGPADRYKQLDHEKFGKLTNLKKIKAAEKPHGEWNTYEVVAEGPVVTLKINGQVVNEATGCDVVPGKICLTSEGDEIHFRNIRLIPKGKPTDK